MDLPIGPTLSSEQENVMARFAAIAGQHMDGVMQSGSYGCFEVTKFIAREPGSIQVNAQPCGVVL
jgi:hypothetical protein